jgi:hypothetical protein
MNRVDCHDVVNERSVDCHGAVKQASYSSPCESYAPMRSGLA